MIRDVERNKARINEFLKHANEWIEADQVDSIVMCVVKRDAQVITGLFPGAQSAFFLIGAIEDMKDVVKRSINNGERIEG